MIKILPTQTQEKEREFNIYRVELKSIIKQRENQVYLVKIALYGNFQKLHIDSDNGTYLCLELCLDHEFNMNNKLSDKKCESWKLLKNNSDKLYLSLNAKN